MELITKRPILLALVLIGVCIGTYFAGLFYHQFLNDPLDFASLVLIIVIYVGAVYHQVRGFERS
jgi:NhaP-type Na+/H+ or K+/H+ antiporter